MVAAVTSLNLDGFDVLDEMVVATFSTRRHCIQVTLSKVTFIVSLLINLLINKTLALKDTGHYR